MVAMFAVAISALYVRSSLAATGTLGILMEVEWVMQGYDLSYTGFMCELLGTAAALKEQIPLLVLQKSSFRTGTTLGESHLSSRFLGGLFTEEQTLLGYLIHQNSPSPQILANANVPQPMFGSKFVPSDMSCDSGNVEQTYFNGGEMTRHQLETSTFKKCCEACVSHPLCHAWTHDDSSGKCSLKSRLPMMIGPTLTSHQTSGYVIGESIKQTHRPPAPRAIIFHGTTCIHRNESFAGGRKRDVNTILIGRYMVERASFSGGLDLNEYAVVSCASVVDMIWVPTLWHVSAMQKLLALAGGYAGKRIRVVPETVNTKLFDPAKVSEQALALRRERGGSVRERCRLVNRVSVDAMGQVSEGGKRIECSANNFPSNAPATDYENNRPPPKQQVQQHRLRFEFLSVFKWERRKGWDVLLRAWFRAFSRDDDVCLRLRTYLPSFLGGDPNITAQIEQFSLGELGISASEQACVIWEQGSELVAEATKATTATAAGGTAKETSTETTKNDENSLSRQQMRDLYSLADAFVLPTRGEGWGIPVVEAMAMGLPVIVTNYSGPTEYANEENAYLLPITGLDEYDFAVPDESALVELLWQVVADSLLQVGESNSNSNSNSNSDSNSNSNSNSSRTVTESSNLTKSEIKGKKGRESMKRLNGDFVAEVIKGHLREEAESRGWKF